MRMATALIALASLFVSTPSQAEYVVLWHVQNAGFVLWTGPGSNGTPTPSGQPLPMGDFDADGQMEIATLHTGGAYYYEIRDASTGAVEGEVAFNLSGWPRAAAIDVDGDHYPELVIDAAYELLVIDHVQIAGAAPSSDSPDVAGASAAIGSTIHPNPFNPSATIEYSVPIKGHASFQIFDVAGRSIRMLLDEPVQSGSGSVVWDGRADDGNQLPSGTYFYTLSLDGQVLDKGKAVILK